MRRLMIYECWKIDTFVSAQFRRWQLHSELKEKQTIVQSTPCMSMTNVALSQFDAVVAQQQIFIIINSELCVLLSYCVNHILRCTLFENTLLAAHYSLISVKILVVAVASRHFSSNQLQFSSSSQHSALNPFFCRF